jgi:hypothetical protein
MQPSPTLHSLIHALTQAEKRYLRLYLERHRKGDQNQSAALLDLLAGVEVYDEAQIKGKWVDLGWDATQFASVKHYLYDLALQAMRDFHRKRNMRGITEDLLTDADFLYRRGLLSEALKHLDKARKLAIQFDYPGLVLQADALARTLALRTPADEALPLIMKLEVSSSNALKLQSLITEIQQLQAQLTILTRQRFRLRDEAGKALLESMRENKVLHKALADGHFTSRMHALRCMVLLASLEGDHAAIWIWQQQLMAHWQGNSAMQRELSTVYLITLVNRLAFCQITDRFQELEEAIGLLEFLDLHSPIERIEVIHNIAYYRLLLAINQHDWAAVETSVEALGHVVQVHGAMIPDARKLAIRYNVAIAFFLIQQPKKTLTALNTILNDAQSQHREDLQQAARLLQAVMHYELGNHDLLDYILRNLKRHLQVKHALHAFEASLVKALRDLLARPDDQASILQQLKEKLLALTSDAANAHAPGLEEMQHWVEAKLQGRLIREMLGTPPKG